MKRFLRLAYNSLEDGTRDVLAKEIIERVSTTGLDPDADEAILANIGAHALTRYLPGEILYGLQVFAASGCHALLLRNLPGQEYPPTPVTGFGDEAELAMTNALHFGLIQLIGLAPFAVEYENNAKLIRNVVPNPEAEGTASSWGSDVEFFWHTDNPQLSFGDRGANPRMHVPRYLTLYGIRNHDRVPTYVAAVEDVIAHLDDRTHDCLLSGAFEVGAPASNDSPEGGQVLEGTSVLELSPEGHPWVRFDRGTTRGQTPDAVGALEEWSQALAQASSRQFCLDVGDFLIFDNYRVLHRRPAFDPRAPETARWLRRCYAS